MIFLPISNVTITDPFWAKTQDLVRDTVLPYQWEILNDRVPGAEKSHCIANFKIAGGLEEGAFYGAPFQDTDLYKWIEAVSYCLMRGRNDTLLLNARYAVSLIERAQRPNGYLDTYFTIAHPEQMWKNLMEGHELYCAGHLIEAAVAYRRATGEDALLNVAIRLADHIDGVFGEGKRRGYPGHPEIELALMRLYEETGEARYMALAAYFIRERGRGENVFERERVMPGHSYIFPEMAHFRSDYFQSHAPVTEQTAAAGHAVRAMYLYCAMADLARAQDDAELKAACARLYQNTINKQMYITGGIGSAALGERFTTDYDLPNDSVYAETCASVGLMLLSSRMFLSTGDAQCYSVWERCLRNTVLSGMGQDGRRFFYVNPLRVNPDAVRMNPTLSHVKTQRPEWFGVACCPPNLARLIGSLSGYLYCMDGHDLYILAHIGSDFCTEGLSGSLSRDGNRYRLTVTGEEARIHLRVPDNAVLRAPNAGFEMPGFFSFRHSGGTALYEYEIEPKVSLYRADPRVEADAGKVAVVRGQTVYCAEQADQAAPLCALYLPGDARFTEERANWLPEGMPALRARGMRRVIAPDMPLYTDASPVYEPCEIVLVPYCQWGNRGEGEMSVWIGEYQNTRA